MRFFCKGSVVEWDDGRFEGLLRKMGKKRIEGARAVILLDVFKVGFGIFEILLSEKMSCLCCVGSNIMRVRCPFFDNRNS